MVAGRGTDADPDGASSALDRARILLELSRPEQAISLLQRHLAGDPEDADALCLLSQAHAERGDASAALRTAGAAVDAAPEQEWPLRLLALALSRAGRHAEALHTAGRAVELAPELWQAHVAYACVAADAGDRPTAWLAANHAVMLAPEEPDTHYTVGRLSIAAADWDTAEQVLRRALVLAPGHADALNALGVVQERRGRTTAAAQAYLAASKADPHGLAPANAESLVWSMLAGLQGGLAAGLVILVARTVPDDVNEISTTDLRLLMPGLAAVFLAWIGLKLVGLPAPVRRSALRTLRRRWGAVSTAGSLLALAVANLAPYAGGRLRPALVSAAIGVLGLAFTASRRGSRASGADEAR